MNCIDVKKTTTTQMKIKKATVSEGKLYIDGEERNFIELLSNTFEDSIFDITVVEKTVETDENE